MLRYEIDAPKTSAYGRRKEFPGMNLHELKCFQAVYRERSINRAAKSLFITSQGLGKLIQNLEKELGTVLFERSARGVEPTESARILYERAEHLVEEFEAIEKAIRQLNDREKQLRIGCARGVLNAMSIQVLLRFIEAHPETQVTWRENSNDQVKRDVISMDLDVGLVVGHTEDPEVEELMLDSKEIRILVYQGHPFYNRKKLALKELQDEKILILNEEYRVYHDYREACRKAGFQPRIMATTEDSHFLYKLCKQQQGLGVLLDFSTDDFRMEGVRMIPLEEPVLWDIYFIYRRRNRDFDGVRKFREHLMK